MYEIKGKDLYSQNGEGLLLEYIFHCIGDRNNKFVDIGGSEGFFLSNTKHLSNLGWYGIVLDRETGVEVNCRNVVSYIEAVFEGPDLISIDTDGNDYWLLETILEHNFRPRVIIAEFNAMYTDSRTIVYNPDHVWQGDSYYGFTFEAGQALAERFGYKVIFQVANMNIIMVREDLVKVSVPPVTYKQNDFFKISEKVDWVMI